MARITQEELQRSRIGVWSHINGVFNPAVVEAMALYNLYTDLKVVIYNH